MRIQILARNRFNYSNKRFREEAKELGIKLKIIDPAEYDLVLGRRSPMLFRNGKSAGNVDVVIPRMGASVTNYGLAVIAQFEMMGIPVLNDSNAIQATRNKLRCFQLMSRHDIDIPKTVIIRHPSELQEAVNAVEGFPIVLKLLSGTQGVGVMLVENMQTMKATLDTLWSLGQDILIQECIKESLGRDVRVIVVGDKVVAAMRRQARIGDFRANVHRGGVATKVEISEELKRISVESAKIVGLHVAGVDVLESHSGPKVIEVNSSPGMEGIEMSTGMNVAKEVLEYACRHAEEKSNNT